MSLQQVQSRYNQLCLRIDCFLNAASEADRVQQDAVRDNVKKILYIAFEKKKTAIKGGKYRHLLNMAFVTAGTLGRGHEFFDNLGKIGQQKITETNQEIKDLEIKFLQAQTRLDKLGFDVLVMILRILGTSGLESALDYCLQETHIVIRLIRSTKQNPPRKE